MYINPVAATRTLRYAAPMTTELRRAYLRPLPCAPMRPNARPLAGGLFGYAEVEVLRRGQAPEILPVDAVEALHPEELETLALLSRPRPALARPRPGPAPDHGGRERDPGQFLRRRSAGRHASRGGPRAGPGRSRGRDHRHRRRIDPAPRRAGRARPGTGAGDPGDRGLAGRRLPGAALDRHPQGGGRRGGAGGGCGDVQRRLGADP